MNTEGGPFTASGMPASEFMVWRVVYFHPNRYSDEAIAVGVMGKKHGYTYICDIQSTKAFGALGALFGEGAKEQAGLALNVLREAATRKRDGLDLASFESPTDVLSLGGPTSAHCADMSQFCRDLLRLSSSLFRRYPVKPTPEQTVIGQKTIITELRRRILGMHPQLGHSVVTKRPVNEFFSVPFCGDHGMGAPVSFDTSRVSPAIRNAEALMLRLGYARKVLNLEPFIFLYTPEPPLPDEMDMRYRRNDGLNEIRVLGEDSGVTVVDSTTLDELAQMVLLKVSTGHDTGTGQLFDPTIQPLSA